MLVTGGAGYVGSHVCKQLALRGLEPVSYDNLTRGHRELVKWGPLEEGDILDQSRLEAMLKRYQPAAVMHFAALAYVGESVDKPELYQRVNVEGSRSLLRAMTAAKTPKLVFSSTCSTYGNPQYSPIDERHPQRPVNPYGMTKLDIERDMSGWAKETGGEGVIFRYFNAAGADPDGEIGEWHEPETHLIPLALAAASGEIESLTIHGNDYDTPDGTCVRDYIHVTDLASAHLLGLAYGPGAGRVAAFNLGNGIGYSVDEVVRAVSGVTGVDVPHQYGPRRPGDPPRLIGDASLATKVLGWKPALAELERIVGTAWQWYRRSSKFPSG